MYVHVDIHEYPFSHIGTHTCDVHLHAYTHTHTHTHTPTHTHTHTRTHTHEGHRVVELGGFYWAKNGTLSYRKQHFQF